MTPEIEVSYRPESKRYVAKVAGSDAEAFIDVMPGETAWVFSHVEVAPALEGKRVASRMVQAALADIRSQGLAIMPLCPYVLAYLRRHPEETDVVHPRFKNMVGG
ncbi:MAG: N-acetyltransferase [Trueperaceae bacterium]|nr:N-acetyltransferase [Trueperaceae bacterium]